MGKRLKYIKSYMPSYVLRFIVVFLIIIATTVIVAFYPYLFGKLVDVLFYDKNVSLFLKIVLIYVIIYMVNQVLHYRIDIMMAKLRIDFSFDIKKSLFHKVLTYKCKTLSELNTGDIISRINNDAEEVLNIIYHDIFYGISAFLDFVMCFAFIAYINLSLAGVSLVLVIITFIIANVFKNKLKPLYDKITRMSASNQSWLFELLNGMCDIGLINATKRCIDKYMNNENTLIETNYDVVKLEVQADRTNSAVQVLTSLTIYIMAAFFIFNKMLTLGGLVASIDYLCRMVLTLNRVYARVFSISRRLISIDRIMEIEDMESEIDQKDASDVEITKGEIVFSNVSFSYMKERRTLNGLNLHIYPGEKIALVGKSGEGKSTIAEILCRFYEIDQGEITIDGRNISEYPIYDLRRQIGLVNQTTTMLNSTIRYNLAFTNDKEYDEKIWAALKLVEMDQAVKKMPEGLDTILTPSNTGLSGGQNQRLSLARVYIKMPQILIFDESTSAIDENMESNITKSWDDLFHGHTTLIITHRLSTILNCDRIAFIENGKILGCDTHKRLLESCEQYKILFKEQFSYKFEVEDENQYEKT